VLNGVSPLVWRRLLVSSETNLADLHEILQLAFGWSGFYLYEFRIHGRTFGEERSVCLADLQLHPGERFRYCYNFFVFWECDVRLEAILPRQGELTHPRCVGGRHPAPDEDDGGAWGYQQLQDHYKFAPLEATTRPLITSLPPVTALRSPPLSRTNGVDAPVIAASSTVAK
jgi:hypothetical protein